VRILLAAQTTGGALSGMLAPAKVIVGCSTTGIKARDGDVLRVTVDRSTRVRKQGQRFLFLCPLYLGVG
jgi:L-lactate permease